MKLGEFVGLFQGWDPDMEVQVRVTTSSDDPEALATTLEEWIGDYCEVSDERSVLIENGKVTIIGDWFPE